MEPLDLDTTHAVRDACLCLHAQRTARALARRFDDALRPSGLTNGQFSLLTALNRPRPAGMASIAALLGMDRTTLTAALKPLQRRALIRVAVDPADRRGRLLSLTPTGRRTLQRALPLWRGAQAEVEARLARGEADRLRHSLRKLER